MSWFTPRRNLGVTEPLGAELRVQRGQLRARRRRGSVRSGRTILPVTVRHTRIRRLAAGRRLVILSLSADTGSEDTVIRRKPADQLEEHRGLHLSCVADLVDG